MPLGEVDAAVVWFFDGKVGAVSEAANAKRKLGATEDVKGAIWIEASGDQ